MIDRDTIDLIDSNTPTNPVIHLHKFSINDRYITYLAIKPT